MQISFSQKLYTCTVKKGYSAGITSFWTRNPPKEWNSAGNHQILNVEIHRMKLYNCTVNGYSARITGFWTRNPPEEWNSAGITSSWTWIQTGKIKNLPNSNNSRIINSKGSLPHKTNFLKFKHGNVIKMKNKPDPAL
jgi:hypothetical protein